MINRRNFLKGLSVTPLVPSIATDAIKTIEAQPFVAPKETTLTDESGWSIALLTTYHIPSPSNFGEFQDVQVEIPNTRQLLTNAVITLQGDRVGLVADDVKWHITQKDIITGFALYLDDKEVVRKQMLDTIAPLDGDLVLAWSDRLVMTLQ